MSARPGPAREGPVAGPSLVSPVYQDNKLEDVEGLPGGRLRTAHPVPTVQSGIDYWKYPSAGPRRASPKFPPGQWTDMFAQLVELLIIEIT